MDNSINVFILGSRGYTKKYGGWETLVHGLIDNKIDKRIKYFVYEPVNDKKDEGIFKIDNITCIKLYVKQTGSYQMIFFDIKSLKHVRKYIKKNCLNNCIVLNLGPRTPYMWLTRGKFKRNNIVLMQNPGGVEWKRPKWGKIAQLYIYITAYLTGIASDNIICDSEGIREIYNELVKSKKHKKDFAAYGIYPIENFNPPKSDKIIDYFSKFGIKENQYYLIINRFMPENSYELILSEFVKSTTKRELVLVTNIDKENDFYQKLNKKIPFSNDHRIKFVGTLYDNEILTYLRLHAFAYINGHTLGGTNPGLLEAMYTTGCVLAYDVVFSREACSDYAIYFDKKNTLTDAINKVENMPSETKEQLIVNARKRMMDLYNWHVITEKYETIFINSLKEKTK